MVDVDGECAVAVDVGGDGDVQFVYCFPFLSQEVDLVRVCFNRRPDGATAVLLIPFLRGGENLAHLASHHHTITYTRDSNRELRALGDPPAGVQVVILMPLATTKFLGERVVDHLLKSHKLTVADVFAGIYSQSGKLPCSLLTFGM